jgi:hypothetical protein
MKKREAILGILILCFGILLPLIFAQEITQTIGENEQAKVDTAYACLQGRVTNCSSLVTEDKIFVLLATGQCKNEVIADARNATPVQTGATEQRCWPSQTCNLKMTAQAILALEGVGEDTTSAKNWILNQKVSPGNINWFLQIDSINSEAMACTITPEGITTPVSITIDAEKKITPTNLGICFINQNYWLRINSGCYNKEFAISCDKDFLTTLFFTESGAASSTYHVLDKVNSGTATQTTLEKINSFCFGVGGNCNPEGSLWSALALYIIGEDTSAYMPYLVTMTDIPANEQYLPWAFLYILTGDQEFYNSLLLKQTIGTSPSAGSWRSNLYSTALALYPLKNEEFDTKPKAKDWILSKQNTDGCFGTTKDTAFILHSVWPRPFSGAGGDGTIITEETSCEDSGFFCMSEIECIGNVLESYSCASLISKCCDIAKPLESCIAQQGETCNSNQNCIGGTTVEASLISYGETCCIGGVCEIPSEAPAVSSGCESVGGLCRATGCEATEEESTEVCDFGDTCCVEKSVSAEGKSYWWVWLLLFLIVLVVLGIVFRDKLRPLYLRIKEKFNSIFKKKSEGPGARPPFIGRPGFPPRAMPPPRFGPPTGRPGARPAGEIDDVLKKLKEMGK